MANKYKASPTAFYDDKTANVIGRRLEKLPTVTPEAIITDATDPESPLHKFFQWDDATAAESWRRFQARQLVNHLLVAVQTPAGTVWSKAFHNIKVVVTNQNAKPEIQRVYLSAVTVKEQPLSRDQVIANAKLELMRWKAKYEQYSDIFGSVLSAISETVEEQATAYA